MAQEVDGERLFWGSITGSSFLHLVVEFLTTKSLLHCGFDGLCISSFVKLHLEETDLDFGHSELLETSMESIADFFSRPFVFLASLRIPHIDNNWESVLEVVISIHRHLLEEPLIGKEFFTTLIVLQLRSSESSTLKDLSFALYFDIPFSPLGLLKKSIDHAINGLKLFCWVNLDFVQELSHVRSTISDLIWNSVEKTEFWRNEVFSSSLFSDEHGLGLRSDLEFVLLKEVLGYADFDAVA